MTRIIRGAGLSHQGPNIFLICYFQMIVFPAFLAALVSNHWIETSKRTTNRNRLRFLLRQPEQILDTIEFSIFLAVFLSACFSGFSGLSFSTLIHSYCSNLCPFNTAIALRLLPLFLLQMLDCNHKSLAKHIAKPKSQLAGRQKENRDVSRPRLNSRSLVLRVLGSFGFGMVAPILVMIENLISFVQDLRKITQHIDPNKVNWKMSLIVCCLLVSWWSLV